MKFRVLMTFAFACALAVCTAGDFDDVKEEPAGKKSAAGAKAKAGSSKKAGAKETSKAGAKDEPKAEAKKPGAKDEPKADTKKPGAKADAKNAGAKEEPKPAAKDAGETRTEPTEAEMAKAIKNKKPFYTKFAEGCEVAWKCGQPLLVACVPAGTPVSQTFESKVLKHKAFFKEFVPQNAVLVIWRLKPGKVDAQQMQQQRGRRNDSARRPQATSIDVRPLKGDELDFLKKYGPAKATAKFSDMSNYPTLICLDKTGKKRLFRMPRYEANENSSFGVWFSQVVDFYRAAGIEPKLSPYGKKICENPQEPKKWK